MTTLTERRFDFASTGGDAGVVIEDSRVDQPFPSTYVSDEGGVEIGDMRFFAAERAEVIAWLRHIADRIEASS